MRTIKTLLVALVALVAIGPAARAQGNLPVSLFERYLEALRQQSGIPGLSAAIVQNGRVVWDNGLRLSGRREFDRARPPKRRIRCSISRRRCPRPSCCSSAWSSATCELTDRVQRWNPDFPDTSTTMAQLLSHTSPAGTFKYDPDRFAALTGVADQCANSRYVRLLTEEIFNRLGMSSSMPGADVLDPSSPHRRWINASTLDRYAAIYRHLAAPYKVDSRGRADAFERAGRHVERRDRRRVHRARSRALRRGAGRDGVLLEASTRSRAWESAGSAPAGLGWFV